MCAKERSIEDRLTGRGTVRRGEDKLAEVRYTLHVLQEYNVSRTFGGTSRVPGMKDVSGLITVISGEHMLTGKGMLTLELEDGRQWDFLPTSGDPVTGIYEVVASGGQGLRAPK
jgi:hypothetical protein